MQSYNLPGKSRILIFRLFMALLLNSTGNNINHCSYLPPTQIQPSLSTLNLDGNISFKQVHHAASDFGNRFHFLPAAVLYPKSVSDISSLINHVLQMGPSSKLTIAARGRGHSLQGQSQAYQGIVVSMESLKSPKIHIHTGKLPYVDASGGELWINILHETLKHGFSPKSWTDYLHLTIGGTLSYAFLLSQARETWLFVRISKIAISSMGFLVVLGSLVSSPRLEYLREKGLWDVPHPWLSLLVPKSSIHKFAEGVFGNILTDSSNGPILIYPDMCTYYIVADGTRKHPW